MKIYENLGYLNWRDISGKRGIPTQLLVTQEYKTGTKLMLRQSPSTLVKYVNYLFVISANINENHRSKRTFAKKKKKKKNKQGGLLISKISFIQLFNIQMTKFKYSWI